jgi:hypothetical protein
MKMAIATGICFSAVILLTLAAIVVSQHKCSGFVYEFEFHSAEWCYH